MPVEFPQQFKRDVYQKAVARRENIPTVITDRHNLVDRLSSPEYSKYKKSDVLIDMAKASIARATEATPLTDLQITQAKIEIRDDLEDTAAIDPDHLEYWEDFYGLKLDNLRERERSRPEAQEFQKRSDLRERAPLSYEKPLVYIGNGFFVPLTVQKAKVYRSVKINELMQVEEIAEVSQFGKTDDIAVERTRTSISQLNRDLKTYGVKIKQVSGPKSPYGITGLRPEADLGPNTQQIMHINGSEIPLPTRLVQIMKALGSAESVTADQIESMLYPEYSPRNKAKVLRAIENLSHRISASGYEVIQENGSYKFKKIPEGITLDGKRIPLTPQMLKIWEVFGDDEVHPASELALKLFGRKDPKAIESAISLISDVNERIEPGNVQINRESTRGVGEQKYRKTSFDTLKPQGGTKRVEFRDASVILTASEREVLTIVENKPCSIEDIMELTGRSFSAITAAFSNINSKLNGAKSAWEIGRTTTRSWRGRTRIQIYDIAAK